jgi:hypothetical protein
VLHLTFEAAKPQSTFGNVKADVLALKDSSYKRLNFCSIILGSEWGDPEQIGANCHNPVHSHG